MSEITVNTDQVVDALLANIDDRDVIIAMNAAVTLEVRRIVTAEVKTSIKDAVRAAVGEAMPAMQEAIKGHVADEMKVRTRRLERRIARAVAEGEG